LIFGVEELRTKIGKVALCRRGGQSKWKGRGKHRWGGKSGGGGRAVSQAVLQFQKFNGKGMCWWEVTCNINFKESLEKFSTLLGGTHSVYRGVGDGND